MFIFQIMRQFDLTQYFVPNPEPNITNIIFTYLTKVGALLSIIINGLYYALKSSGWPLTCTKNKYEARVTFEGMASFCYVNNIWTAANLEKITEKIEIPIDEDMNFVSIRYIC